MFYFFRRNGSSIRCEVRADSGGNGYELIVDRPDAMISVEHFVEPPDLNRRWREIERTRQIQETMRRARARFAEGGFEAAIRVHRSPR